MRLCQWRSEWFGRVDVEACPAAATRGEFCPVHAAELFRLAEDDPAATAQAVATRERIRRLYSLEWRGAQ